MVLYLHHTRFMVLHGFCTGFAQILHGAGVICCGMLIRWCVTQPARSGDPFPRLHATVQWLFTTMTSSTLEQHHHNSLTTSYARLRALWSREQRDKSRQRVNILKASSITLSESILNWFCWLPSHGYLVAALSLTWLWRWPLSNLLPIPIDTKTCISTSTTHRWNIISNQKLQQALKSRLNFSLVLIGKGREKHRTTFTNPRNNWNKSN